MSGERWALYFAPDSGSDLAQVGAAILGRDAESGRELEQPALPGVLPERFAQLTESPRRYGLHATLKAPFRLAEGRSAADLSAAVRRFAARTAAVDIPGLRLERLGFFLALAPAVACPAIRILAAACVAEFDGFRAPAPPRNWSAAAPRGSPRARRPCSGVGAIPLSWTNSSSTSRSPGSSGTPGRGAGCSSAWRP